MTRGLKVMSVKGFGQNNTEKTVRQALWYSTTLEAHHRCVTKLTVNDQELTSTHQTDTDIADWQAIHPFLYLLLPILVRAVGIGSYPSCHWVRGRVLPGQVAHTRLSVLLSNTCRDEGGGGWMSLP